MGRKLPSVYGKSVTLVGGKSFELTSRHAEWLADGVRLFESAPLLLATAKAALAVVEGALGSLPIDRLRDAVECRKLLRSAILAAEGGVK